MRSATSSAWLVLASIILQATAVPWPQNSPATYLVVDVNGGSTRQVGSNTEAPPDAMTVYQTIVESSPSVARTQKTIAIPVTVTDVAPVPSHVATTPLSSPDVVTLTEEVPRASMSPSYAPHPTTSWPASIATARDISTEHSTFTIVEVPPSSLAEIPSASPPTTSTLDPVSTVDSTSTESLPAVPTQESTAQPAIKSTYSSSFSIEEPQTTMAQATESTISDTISSAIAVSTTSVSAPPIITSIPTPPEVTTTAVETSYVTMPCVEQTTVAPPSPTTNVPSLPPVFSQPSRFSTRVRTASNTLSRPSRPTSTTSVRLPRPSGAVTTPTWFHSLKPIFSATLASQISAHPLPSGIFGVECGNSSTRHR